MKNKKICPKCNSTDIIRVPANLCNKIQAKWSRLSMVVLHRYVCCNCGFSEEWIDTNEIQLLKENL